MLPLTKEEKNYIVSKIFVNYAEKNLVIIMMMVKSVIKVEITVITQKNEALHIIFLTLDMKYQKKFLWYFIMALIMNTIL